MMDPECELSERERRQDPTPFDWGADVPFQGESLPDPILNTNDAHALAESPREPWRLHWDGEVPANVAARDAEVMAFDDWRVLYAVDADGRLVFV